MGENLQNFSFKGEFQYALDAKGRMSLPLKLRKNVDLDTDRIFIITRHVHGDGDQCEQLFHDHEPGNCRKCPADGFDQRRRNFRYDQ